MAINFLNTVDLNKNQLNNAAIQNLAADPATGVEGQIYFNTVVDALKIYANGAWIEVGATSGVETITIGNANVNSGGVNTGLVRTPVAGTGDIILTPAIYGGGANVGMVPTGGTVGKYLDGAGNWLDVTTGDITAVLPGTYINVDNSTGPEPTINHDLTTRTDTTSTLTANVFPVVDSVSTNTTGHITAINIKTVTVPDNNDNTTYTLTTTPGPQVPTAITSADINLIGSDSSTDTATIAGVVQEILISETGDTITAKLADGAYGSGAELKLPDGARATTQTAGTNDDRIATTAFVQTATTGLLQLVGGFNANTGALVAPLTGNLTSGATRVALEVGDYYVVTVDGNFFGNAATPLTVGDSVIVQTAAVVGASVETDFIIVQSDTDLASATTVGIGNSTASTVIDKLGINVTYTNPTDGTATIGVDINAQTDMPDALANTDQVLLYDASSGKNYKASIEKFSGHGSKRVSLNTSVTGISNQTSPPAGTQGWVIASNTIMGTVAMDCSIELMTDTANTLGAGLTVYAEVSRASNAITVNFTAPSAIAQGEYQVIITRA